MTGTETSSAWPPEFGVNEWMLEELYDKFLEDRHSVDRAWWPLLEAHADQSAPALSAPHEVATGTAATRTADEPGGCDDDTRVVQIHGAARSLVSSMEASRQIPTATSVRTMPAKLLIDNRFEINEHRVRIRRSKVGFTHLIGWAVVQAVNRYPGQNVHYEELDGKPSVAVPAHLNLGIAVDVARPDGARTLQVPNVKAADSMGFADFVRAYDDVVHRARTGALTVADFAGTTLSLTNPGGIGTQHSVPRLMPGQGCIIGAGALEYPAAFQGADAQLLADLAVGKTITLTSTYDHRVIQGAGSGEFLGIIEELLLGRHHFYEDIFTALRIPYTPIRWAHDLETGPDGGADKTTRIQELIHAYRVRGHRVADVDPLEYRQKSRRDLDIAGHGLTLWDLDREFTTGLLAGERRRIPLRGILGVLRDSYCRTVGIEYMHIQDPAQREWIQRRVESPVEEPSHDGVLRILGKLNEAEAFETFLQTKYVGQTRFSLEGGESTIALLDAVVSAAARAGLEEVAIAMAHRGRLNVLANIAGKTYGQIFHEFEGSEDPLAGEGSGDVKYHLGTEGTYRGAAGESIAVTVAANPSHLDAVDGVLEGIVRAKQDRHPIGSFPVLPIIVHGDAAMAGQGIVAETLQMSQLRGYRTGGSIRVTINNQVGFTTLPGDARSSTYSTDVAKAVQAPIFHVNGDDPEAVVRVAELAFAYRQEFHRDVVVDLICYRRRGHNEGDDPSMTQPRMYSVIGTKESVRRLYSEAALDRGAISEAEYEATQRDFQDRLETAFAEMRKPSAAPAPGKPAETAEGMADGDRLSLVQEPADTGAPLDRIARVGAVFASPPEGFTVHPKLQQLLIKREGMSRDGTIDWAFGELLAVGTLLMEGVTVRFAGQDSRRGTFAQRHAVLHDFQDGREWSPLGDLSDDQGRFWIYDSLLSEYAAMGFEYGYSVENSDALVLWEAQFGDFVNGAQIVVDEFVSSAEQKWGQPSSLVLLLPHGFEGRGPDHSSGRIERFLQLCAQQNMTVACPSTPASYFHLLRRQAQTRPRKPLVVFTPKSMLRTKAATSDVHEFVSGRFEPVIDDASVCEPGRVERVVLVAGKLYYELRAALTRSPDPRIALVRVERFFPLPADELAATLARYPGAEVVWAQEEPRNQGAWSYLLTETTAIEFSSALRVISRPPSASPATGSAARHQEEQKKLVSRILDVDDANGAGGAHR